LSFHCHVIIVSFSLPLTICKTKAKNEIVATLQLDLWIHDTSCFHEIRNWMYEVSLWMTLIHCLYSMMAKHINLNVNIYIVYHNCVILYEISWISKSIILKYLSYYGSCFLPILLNRVNCKRAIGKRYVSITYTFWGQKKIETDVCPRETFNDSCSTHVCKSVFHVFYTLGRNYTKNSNKMICIEVDRFCFWNLKKSIWKMNIVGYT